jgi:Helix-turn-helix domain
MTSVLCPVQTVASKIFVHSSLDDLGLSATEFRVFCHLARRGAKDEYCRPGHESIAKICKLEIKTVRKALASLEQRGMIRVESRPGETNVYVLMPPNAWRSDDIATANPSTPPNPPQGGTGRHPGWKTDRQVGCQLGGGSTQSAPYEGYPSEAIPEGNPKTQALSNASAAVASSVCEPAAALLVQEDRTSQEPLPAYVRKTQSELWKQFETLWNQLKTEYRGDKKPAWQAFAELQLNSRQLESMLHHRKSWEERSFASESGQSGWVPKPKQFANYLRSRQFESPLPEPRPLRSMPSVVPTSMPTASANTEAEQIAELKHMGIVGLDLLNGRAELEDDYAFAVDLVGTHRYSEILEHKDRLLEIHTSKQSQ